MNTFKLYEQLKTAFPQESAETLAHVLADVLDQIQNTVSKQDFAELKGVVRDLAEAQKRTEQRVEELAEAQKRTAERVGSLEAAVEKLAEAQKRTEQRVEELTAAVQQLALIGRAHENRLAKLDGRMLELEFRQKASAYLGVVMRRTRIIPVGDLGDDLERVLTPEEWAELTRSDVILRGRAEIGGQRREVYAVVEVSVTLDEGDVARAARRAALLRKKGWKTLAVAAGEEADPRLIETAARAGVAVLQDGRQFNWSEALAAA